MTDAGKELQATLKAGDLIVATKDGFLESGYKHQSAGDIIMVDNPRVGSDMISGTGIYSVSEAERCNAGLGCLFRVDSFRLATPHDEGFVATREQWSDWKDSRIKTLMRDRLIMAACIVVMAILYFLK